jgi:toxin ParE1/3/4
VSRRVVVRPLAKEDLDEQARYIARDSVAAALRFLDAAESAFDRLSSMNEVGRRRAFLHPELAQVRSWPIPGFEKHVIFYRVAEGGVDVLRVLQASRDLERIFGSEER